MYNDQIVGRLREVKGRLKELFGQLTGDASLTYKGQREQFFGIAQRKYGVDKAKAQAQLQKWEMQSAGRSFDN